MNKIVGETDVELFKTEVGNESQFFSWMAVVVTAFGLGTILGGGFPNSTFIPDLKHTVQTAPAPLDAGTLLVRKEKGLTILEVPVDLAIANGPPTVCPDKHDVVCYSTKLY